MGRNISFPIFFKYADGTLKSFESGDEIEEKIEYFLIEEEKCEVYDSSGQKIIINIFLNEIKDLYPEE
jgi:hypothetical protein